MNTGNHNISRCVVAVLSLLLSGFSTYAQQENVNSIQQDTALYNVFESFSAADSNVISILHLGDSHVQAGYFPLATAFLLQQEFGNAGRGFVFPYNLAGTNGPEDFRWSSTVKWSAERVVDRYKSSVLGPGAIVVISRTNTPTLTFTGKGDSRMDDNFRKVKLFYDAGNTDNSLVVPDAASVTVTPTPFPGSPTVSMATLDFSQTSQSFQVKWEGTGSGPLRFYGAVMENGHNGILYHSVGINGAMYQQYNEINNVLISQMAVLKPQLVIISLGTNEAYGKLDPLVFRNEIDKTVSLIREQNPSVNILLTTPPDCMRSVRKSIRKRVGKKKYTTVYQTAYYPNPYISMVSQQIIGYAREHGLAAWNFNEVNKAQKDRFAGAWAPDHIHFNVRGYQLQGQLLYEALQRSYTQYLQQTKKNPVASHDQRK
ncbi:GDSL-type esterase/lipase family protein [Chitinophaga sp. 30R24]|uniref:GDSL-type esterase/lipase family protein n=1 Tax=Chitinophaga sp. 30R24 TaxID=3248838 RepID=UPI003B8F2B6C